MKERKKERKKERRKKRDRAKEIEMKTKQKMTEGKKIAFNLANMCFFLKFKQDWLRPVSITAQGS
jgi:hypothetical protein